MYSKGCKENLQFKKRSIRDFYTKILDFSKLGTILGVNISGNFFYIELFIIDGVKPH